MERFLLSGVLAGSLLGLSPILFVWGGCRDIRELQLIGVSFFIIASILAGIGNITTR